MATEQGQCRADQTHGVTAWAVSAVPQYLLMDSLACPRSS